MNRLGLKISCFLVSVLIWIQVASTADIEQTTTLPLRVTGLGEGLTVAGSDHLPSEVRVRVTGSKLMLLTHQYFNRYIGEVRVNLAGFADSTFSYQLDRADIFTDMKDADIQRSRILTLTIDHEISRPMAVTLDSEGALPQGLDFVTTPRIIPDTVLVTGPSRFFSDDLSVHTEAVNLSRISGDSEQTLNLTPPGDFLELAETKVHVAFLVGELEDRTLANIPVIGLVDAGRPDVGISPPVADVMVRGIADSVRALTEDRISVIVPVDNLAEGIFLLAGQVVHPDWLTLIRLDPPQFQVIVGNPPILRNDPRVVTDEEDQGE
jgi:YbbR domain-containing protein